MANNSNLNQYLSKYNQLNTLITKLEKNNVYLINLNSLENYQKQLEKCDKEIASLNDQLSNFEKIIKFQNKNQLKVLKFQINQIKAQNQELLRKKVQINQAWNINKKIKVLETKIIQNIKIPIRKKQISFEKLFTAPHNNLELKLYLDALCLYLYKKNLRNTLIVKTPNELKNDFQLNILPSEIKKNVLMVIEEQKIKINNSLIMTDQYLVDVITSRPPNQSFKKPIKKTKQEVKKINNVSFKKSNYSLLKKVKATK